MGGKPSVDLVLRIGREIAAGLVAAHRAGLVHRDIKPANIWLETPNGRVKILDFGQARAEREDVQITQSGAIVGTPTFMSPEQAAGEATGPSSDLFSLGCVLYRLSCGRLPFRGNTILSVLNALASQTPVAPIELVPDLPEELSGLVCRLLAKRVEDRPASAQGVYDEIRGIERQLAARRQTLDLMEEAGPAEGRGQGVQTRTGADAKLNRTGAGDEPGAVKWRYGRVVFPGLAGLAIGVAGLMAWSGRGTGPTGVPEGGGVISAATKETPGPEPTKGETAGALAEPVIELVDERPAALSAETSEDNDAAPVPAAESVIEGVKTELIAGVPAKGAVGVVAPEPAKSEGEAARAGMPERVKPLGVKEAWGVIVDPVGDSRFMAEVGTGLATMEIPGTPHVMSAELRQMNAPRTAKPVRGDFRAKLSVEGTEEVAGRATMRAFPPYHGAGLVLWQDASNYVRLEIATDLNRGKPRHYANFEYRQDAKLVYSKGEASDSGSAALRLVREGDRVTASFSTDGARWYAFPALEVKLADELEIGLVGINTATKPLVARFKDFEVEGVGRPEAENSP